MSAALHSVGKPTDTRPDNIDALTGLRFIAAFTIILGHSYSQWGSVTIIGMPLFFTLSGFIIHYIYSQTFASTWRVAVGKFAAARISRIYPLYFALLTVAFIATPMGRTLWQSGKIYLISAYIFPCYTWLPITIENKIPGEWYYGISWSVPTEIFFYALYALIIFRVNRIHRANSCLFILLLFCFSSYLLFYLIFITRDQWEPLALQHVSGFASRTENFNNSFYRWLLYTSPYARIFEFIAGCITCQLYLLLRQAGRKLGRAGTEFLVWLPAVLIAVTLMIFVQVGEHHPWLAVGNHSFAAFFINLHMNFLLAPVCCLMIFGLAWGRSTLARTLGCSSAVLLGEISYSTYLGHPLAQGFAQGLWLPQWTPAAVASEIVVIYLFSWMFYTAIEIPSKTALRRLFARRPGRAIAVLIGTVSRSNTTTAHAAAPPLEGLGHAADPDMAGPRPGRG